MQWAGKRKKGLTDVERAILAKLDEVLKKGTIEDLQLAAKQIAKLWNEEHTVFQSQLIGRAENWRRAYTRFAIFTAEPPCMRHRH